MNLADKLDSLSAGEKVFGLVLIAVIGYALYIRKKQPQQLSGTAASGDLSGALVSQQPVSSAMDTAGIISAVNAARDTILGGQGQAGGGTSDIVKAIGDLSTKTVQALNDQGAQYVAGLDQAATQINAGLGQLQASETKAFTDAQAHQDTSFNSIGDLITNAFKTNAASETSFFGQLTQYLTTAFGQVSSDMQGVVKQLTDQAAALLKLQNTADQGNRGAFMVLGGMSVAACLRPDNSVDAQCVKTHALDLPTAGFPAAQVPAYVRQTYPKCLTGGSTDLFCVGKQIAGVA